MADPTVSKLVAQRESIKSQIAELGDLPPGSLRHPFRQCGEPNCRCAKPGEAGHGPSWSLTHSEKGETVTFVIPAHRVPQTLEQIAECRRLRDLTQALIDVSEKICDARISDHKTDEASKKHRWPSNWPSKSQLRSIRCWDEAPRMASIWKPSKPLRDGKLWVWPGARLNKG